MSDDFKIWWHNEGSGMPSFKDEETCDHVERVSAIAWSNGAFKATLSLEAENALLKAEVERLEHQVNYWRIEAEVDNARWLRCLQDLEELRASSFVTAVPVEHYERVVKAGDAMADEVNGRYFGKRLTKDWQAAKEGKQP